MKQRMYSRFFLISLCVLFLGVLCGCGSIVTEGDFMEQLTKHTTESFGQLTGANIGSTAEGYAVTEYRVNNAVVLDTYADASTQELKYIRVVLDDASAEVQNAEYFRCISLYCMKAYQKDMQLDTINQIYNTLAFSDTITPGVRKIKDKNILYSLQVQQTGEAVFTVVYQS